MTTQQTAEKIALQEGDTIYDQDGYSGTVAAVSADGTYDIDWSSSLGDLQTGVSRSEIRHVDECLRCGGEVDWGYIQTGGRNMIEGRCISCGMPQEQIDKGGEWVRPTADPNLQAEIDLDFEELYEVDGKRVIGEATEKFFVREDELRYVPRDTEEFYETFSIPDGPKESDRFYKIDRHEHMSSCGKYFFRGLTKWESGDDWIAVEVLELDIEEKS